MECTAELETRKFPRSFLCNNYAARAHIPVDYLTGEVEKSKGFDCLK